MVRGTCLCGAVQYELAPPLAMMMHCHCSMCRKHHGTSFATFVGAPLAAFKWLTGADAVAQYKSSEQGVRAHCRHCGSVAPTLMPAAGFAVAPAGNLEDDPGVRPQAHIYVASKAPWFDITDDLPQFPEMMPL